MYKKDFNELWDKTVNIVLYSISIEGIKGKKQLNECIHEIVWNRAWGNKKLVPPERKLLNDIGREDPKKAMKLEALLSNITIGNGLGLYAGIAAAVLGIIMLVAIPAGQTVWKIVSGAVGVGGITVAAADVLQCNYNPKKAAANVLTKTKEQCDSILS